MDCHMPTVRYNHYLLLLKGGKDKCIKNELNSFIFFSLSQFTVVNGTAEAKAQFCFSKALPPKQRQILQIWLNPKLELGSWHNWEESE